MWLSSTRIFCAGPTVPEYFEYEMPVVNAQTSNINPRRHNIDSSVCSDIRKLDWNNYQFFIIFPIGNYFERVYIHDLKIIDRNSIKITAKIPLVTRFNTIWNWKPDHANWFIYIAIYNFFFYLENALIDFILFDVQTIFYFLWFVFYLLKFSWNRWFFKRNRKFFHWFDVDIILN